MELTPRLKKIAQLVPKDTKTLADVGTDHAYLPVYSLLNGICENAIAMDVNEGPLKRAEENTKTTASKRLTAFLNGIIVNSSLFIYEKIIAFKLCAVNKLKEIPKNLSLQHKMLKFYEKVI